MKTSLFPSRWRLRDARGLSHVVEAGDAERLHAAIDQAVGGKAWNARRQSEDHPDRVVEVGGRVLLTLEYLGPVIVRSVRRDGLRLDPTRSTS